MNASFEEKSVWIQLVCVTVAIVAYFVVAGRMMAAGVMTLTPYVALFMVSVVLMVVLLVSGLIIAAISSRREGTGRDERDRLIEWRAESNSSWLLATGVLAGITGMAFSLHNVWVAHILLLSLYLSEMLAFVLRLYYYRRGV